MRTVAGTIGQTLLILVLAAGIGLGANAWRGQHNKIEIAHPYVVAPAAAPASATTAASNAEPAFQEISAAEVLALLNEPGAQVGQFVFIDARNDEHFREGHIPGAVQCDPWHVEDYSATALPRCYGAEKIVVYCTGGTCEDSLHLCRYLIQSSIPRERIYLFHGGWEEWTKNNYPTATGAQ